MELSLSTRTVDDHTVLEVGGEVDVYTAPRLRERLVELVEAGARPGALRLRRVEVLGSPRPRGPVGALERVRAAGGRPPPPAGRRPRPEHLPLTPPRPGLA